MNKILTLVLILASTNGFSQGFTPIDQDPEFIAWLETNTGVWSMFDTCPLPKGELQIRKSDSQAPNGGGAFFAKRAGGKAHGAVDIESTLISNSKVHAIGSGKVALVGDWPNMGKLVIVEHSGGLYTVYSHLSSITVNEGDEVTKDASELGVIGYTGNAEALRKAGLPAHVHLAVYNSGYPDEAKLPKRITMWKEWGDWMKAQGKEGYGPLNPENWLKTYCQAK